MLENGEGRRAMGKEVQWQTKCFSFVFIVLMSIKVVRGPSLNSLHHQIIGKVEPISPS